MTPFTHRLAAIALVWAAAAVPAMAASSASSAASDSASSTVGSLSDSVKKSSNSSSKDDKVAAGEYRIVAVADGDKPGQLRLQLQALATPGEDGALVLTLPQQVFDKGGLAQGQVVAARHRPYGVEFARADTREAFFLLLEDAWYRELQSNAVVL